MQILIFVKFVLNHQLLPFCSHAGIFAVSYLLFLHANSSPNVQLHCFVTNRCPCYCLQCVNLAHMLVLSVLCVAQRLLIGLLLLHPKLATLDKGEYFNYSTKYCPNVFNSSLWIMQIVIWWPANMPNETLCLLQAGRLHILLFPLLYTWCKTHSFISSSEGTFTFSLLNAIDIPLFLRASLPLKFLISTAFLYGGILNVKNVHEKKSPANMYTKKH